MCVWWFFILRIFCCTEQFSFSIWVRVSVPLCQSMRERQVTGRDASDAITGGLVCNFRSLESAICNRFTAIYNHRLQHLAVIGCRHQKEARLRDAPRSFKTTRFMQMMTQKRQQIQSRYRSRDRLNQIRQTSNVGDADFCSDCICWKQSRVEFLKTKGFAPPA